jgi:hypothetical protein
VKKPVRVAERLVDGAMIEVLLDIAEADTAPRPATRDLRP